MPAAKLNIGMPLYGRAFTSTTGLGKPYSGIGAGSWEPGVYDFKALPLPGHREYYDSEAGATYSFSNATGMLVSYDTVDMALRKADWVKRLGLGGVMWWEIAGDKQGKEGIVENVSLILFFFSLLFLLRYLPTPVALASALRMETQWYERCVANQVFSSFS